MKATRKVNPKIMVTIREYKALKLLMEHTDLQLKDIIKYTGRHYYTLNRIRNSKSYTEFKHEGTISKIKYAKFRIEKSNLNHE